MKRKGTGLMVSGLILVLAAAGLTGYNLLQSHQAQQSSYQVVQVLEQKLPLTEPSAEEKTDEIIPETQPDYVRFPNMEMPVVSVDGQDYIGTVQIPSQQLELPVAAQWSYEALRSAPCRYQGSAYSDDLILMAHNYDSHFGKLRNLRIDDWVTFVDTDGNTFVYRVVEREELPGTAVEDMAAGQWDLTLFTCTYGGKSRITIRCQRIREAAY